MTTIKERVQAGAALLDKVLPDWWDGKEKPTIDLKILNMNNGEMCVLGQCFGVYEDGCKKLALSAWGFPSEPAAHQFGFIGKRGENTSNLTSPWRREIKRRRSVE